MAELDKMMEQARANLTKKKDEVRGKIKALEEELDEIDREFSAINAYEKAKTGKVTGKTRTPGRRKAILDLLTKSNMDRQGILTALNAKGDKSAEQSVSNTLSALKKAGKLRLDDGTYSLS
jgi:hypothetical protein